MFQVTPSRGYLKHLSEIVNKYCFRRKKLDLVVENHLIFSKHILLHNIYRDKMIVGHRSHDKHHDMIIYINTLCQVVMMPLYITNVLICTSGDADYVLKECHHALIWICCVIV